MCVSIWKYIHVCHLIGPAYRTIILFEDVSLLRVDVRQGWTCQLQCTDYMQVFSVQDEELQDLPTGFTHVRGWKDWWKTREGLVSVCVYISVCLIGRIYVWTL